MKRLVAAVAGLLMACNPAPDQADLEGTRGGRVDVFFNDPGTRPDNMWEPDAEDVLVEAIDGAQVTLDLAVMGFTRQRVIDAVVRADDRGVVVRFVGDAGHLYNRGYQTMAAEHIPMVVGNGPHIMHHKFFLIDGRFIFAGTANISPTDLRRNSNNFIYIDSPPVAADFLDEFNQMFAGRFGNTKVEIDNGRVYQVGDTEVEVWFSPNEDAMGRILEYVDAAEESIRFAIFAFTKDQIGSAYVRKSLEFEDMNELDDGTRVVSGVIDQSQLHSNGQFHEVFRLLGAGIPMRMDGNDNGRQPGDYQAGGGRLHSKTMIIDADGMDPLVLTGSFNWSSSATVSNDEFLMVLSGPRVTEAFKSYWDGLWDGGRHLGGDNVSRDGIEPGDVIINEVMWLGVNSQDRDGNDEFIELRNTTDEWINLDLWQIGNENDFVVGLPPGSRIPPNGTFLILDHTLEPYADGVPQDELSAFSGADLVLNPFNDNRAARLYLKDGQLELFLKDPENNIIDVAGDGGPAFDGGIDGRVLRSMERVSPPGDGADRDSWVACLKTEGGENVNEDFKGEIMATPGEENSQ
ncbi:MAG: phosphatidylserine/phosphatidylglycerophosphate/cardiolipin synthase-like enzyme [Myxococcota bacterium]|jgi:phosphatidylserine/phosphatidylglycerophosphate/cardiolipin synthase-like enzyme